MDQPILALVALVCLAAAAVWGRSARYRHRVLRRIERDSDDIDLQELTRSDYRKDLLATVLYGSLFVACAVEAVTSSANAQLVLVLVAVPAVASLLLGRNFVKEARLEHGPHRARAAGPGGARAGRAGAPRGGPSAWPPTTCPQIDGFELGRVYQAGSGLMAGDFYDVIRDLEDPHRRGHRRRVRPRHRPGHHRLPGQVPAAGVPAPVPRPGPGARGAQHPDVGHGAQRGVHLPRASWCSTPTAGTLRFASAGHPAVWLWHEREVQPAAGHRPAADARPEGHLHQPGDPARHQRPRACSTPTVWPRPAPATSSSARSASPARSGVIPGSTPDVLCKSLLEAARDFSSGPITDDVAILAIRRT